MTRKQETGIVVDVKPVGLASALTEEDLERSQASSTLEQGGYKLGSLKDCARLILQEGLIGGDLGVIRNQFRTREGYLHLRNDGEYIIRDLDRLAIKLNQAPEEAHRGLPDLFIYDAILEELRDSFKLGENEKLEISTDKFGNEEFPLWAFGDQAEILGLFLKKSGIPKIYLESRRIGRSFAQNLVFDLKNSRIAHMPDEMDIPWRGIKEVKLG